VSGGVKLRTPGRFATDSTEAAQLRVNMSVSSIYSWVIQDVVKNSHRIFVEEGVDESVLIQLQQVYTSECFFQTLILFNYVYIFLKRPISCFFGCFANVSASAA
jgi:hypothetical protein